VRREGLAAARARNAAKLRPHVAKIGRYVWLQFCKGGRVEFLGTARSIYCKPSCRPKYWKKT
jgi:hypothetical protein